MANKKKPLVFLDSYVFIAGLVFPHWPYEIIKYGETKYIQIVLCPLVIEEVKARIADIFPKHLDKFDNFLKN